MSEKLWLAEADVIDATDLEREWLEEAHRRGVPRRFWSASLTTGLATPALAAVRRWLTAGGIGQGRALCLMGPTGIGKTWSAAAAMRAVGETGRWAWWSYWPSTCAALLDSDRRRNMLDVLTTWRVVVLDDFGTEYLAESGFLAALTDEVIWMREAHELATIITTNLMPEELAGRFSDRIADRLQAPWADLVTVLGPSLRRGED